MYDHAGCVDTHKSTSGGIQFLSDKLVSWMLKKQDCTAMSSTEAEYVALSISCALVMWMRKQLQDYGFKTSIIIPLYCDSQSGHSNLHEPVCALPYQAHPYSAIEDGFMYHCQGELIRVIEERRVFFLYLETNRCVTLSSTHIGKSSETDVLTRRLGHIAALKNELRKLKGKALDKEAIETHSVDPKVSKDNMEPITPKLLNKRTAHSSYIKHTQEEALVLRDIVEHVKANYPQDSLLESAFRYTKVIQELLSHISRTCPSINNFDPQLVAVTPRKKDKKVRFAESLTSTENTKTDSTSNIVSNKRVLHSTGVRLSTSASGSQPSGNTRNDKIQQTPSSNSKNKVEAHPRNVKSSLNKRNGTVKVNGSASVQNSKKHDNSDYVCINGDDCMSSDNLCVSNSMNDVKFRAKPKKRKSKKEIWKPTGKVFTKMGYIWRPTGRTFTVVQIVLWYLDSGCSKHMTGDRSQLTNFISKFLGTVKFRNNQVAKIMGYEDYQIGNVTISRFYYVEGLGHNLFSVRQFCDSNLELAFRQHTCFIRNLEGVDLLTGSRGDNRVRLSTCASGSQPSGNTRNDRIQQTPSSNSKNKVEAHPRNVKSSLNKRNGTVKVNGSVSVQNSKKHVNSNNVCVNSDDCMSSDNLCVSNSMNDVKFCAKFKTRESKKQIWKPTRKVFNKMGYIWRPTGNGYSQKDEKQSQKR
ncbi:hypothetical protein Tco_0679739 [Tanacetum coccineum]|uniref:Retrovirus-related Pol polyprotein from transposon TNT 1-94-like beta-barrel domain-containing protein n=1 Tax=Tanacetum coccineum TaxID=301880 RepID=A0ABQ4XIN1_9ASTR